MVCHAVLSRRRGDNHSFSLRRKLAIIAGVGVVPYAGPEGAEEGYEDIHEESFLA